MSTAQKHNAQFYEDNSLMPNIKYGHYLCTALHDSVKEGIAVYTELKTATEIIVFRKCT